MDAPPEKESCKEFIDVTEHLESIHVNVPHIHYKNIADGILVLTDFGNTSYLDKLSETTADQMYSDAISQLLVFQNKPVPNTLQTYSRQLLFNEMLLFKDWLLGALLDVHMTNEQESAFQQLMELLAENALAQKQVFVHRDYHSRNLMYLDSNNPGIIDYQDAVVGPVSYDLVSLLKDCYIKWPMERVNRWVRQYYGANHELVNVPFEQFLTQFHLMGFKGI